MSGSLRSIFFWRNRWSWGWIGRLPPSRFDLYTAMWKLQELVLLSNCLDCAPPRNTASRYRFAACRYAGAQAQPIFLDIRRSETTDSDLADSIFLSCYNSRRVAKARSWMRGTVLARFRLVRPVRRPAQALDQVERERRHPLRLHRHRRLAPGTGNYDRAGCPIWFP